MRAENRTVECADYLKKNNEKDCLFSVRSAFTNGKEGSARKNWYKAFAITARKTHNIVQLYKGELRVMNIAIAGYGNLGKSLEKAVNAEPDMHLQAVFSRRESSHPLWARFQDAEKFAGKIDVVLLALGSYDDIEENVNYFAPFDTVDSFDTHAKITKYKERLNAVKPDTVSVCCVGWDPGILSIVRGAMGACGGEVATFWGRGISQGHSHALRKIRGVYDAVEITTPKEDTLKQMRDGCACEENSRHCRLCYVACVYGEETRIAQEIVNMPNYFAGQEVKIEFCSREKIAELKRSREHSGEIIARGNGFNADMKLDVQNNTEFTARIMITYANAIGDLKRDGYVGALDPYDIPLKYVALPRLI